MGSFFVYLLFLLFPCIFSNKILSTSYGSIEGITTRSSDGKEVHIFMGIPQTESPLGENRFKKLNKPKKWEGIWNATAYRPACPSNPTQSHLPQDHQSEDCLFLNIFTSEACLQSNSSCPVAVYLHGGQLSYDSAVMFNNTFIVEKYASKDIIFVIPAMRIGVLGLLYFENSTLVPRNLPIYDIVLGLNFVHEEIYNFGGNNSQVTLMGHSAGGALVIALAFSQEIDPEAKLFQQILPMSGPLTYYSAKQRLEHSNRVLIEAGCFQSTEFASLACFKNLPVDKMLQAQRKAEEDGFELHMMTFDPPVGERDEDFEARMDAAPKRNMLAGSTVMEFYYLEDYHGTDCGRFMGLKNNEELLKKFLGDRRNENHPASKFFSHQSQEVFVPCFFYGSLLENKGAKVWLYEYAQPIAAHAKDMVFLIGAHPRALSADDYVVMDVYNKMITNFIKGLEPMPGWLQLNGRTANYFQIRANQSEGIAPKMMTGYQSAVVDYWLTEMKSYDELLEKQSVSSVALPLVIGFILLTVILVTGIVFCCRERQRSAEAQPLLS